MSHAAQLLFRLANAYRQETESFSREEIVRRINEVKYLSAQRNIPRLSLRKEIIHLEHKLQGIFELEKKLAVQKRRESARVSALKRQIRVLQQKLALVEEKDLQKKVERLSHLLADYLARKDTEEDVNFRRKVMQELGMKQERRKKMLGQGAPSVSISAPEPERVRILQQRLHALNEKLEEYTQSGKSRFVEELQPKIDALERKLQGYAAPEAMAVHEPPPQKVPVIENRAESRHKLLFGRHPEEKTEDRELETELPLPPPPK